jgi:protein-S-isoprenylcysteine O-methyltransferase Ste14
MAEYSRSDAQRKNSTGGLVKGGPVLFVKNLLFTVVVPGTAAVYAPLVIARGEEPAGGATLVLAALLFGCGAAVYLWCVWDFAAFGRGTPVPIDAPKRLVFRGLYRYVRNPMYVGVLTTILGWFVLYRSVALAVYLATVGTCFHLFTVLYEERHLRKVFGEEYERYCERVGRWLPRLRRNLTEHEPGD